MIPTNEAPDSQWRFGDESATSSAILLEAEAKVTSRGTLTMEKKPLKSILKAPSISSFNSDASPPPSSSKSERRRRRRRKTSSFPEQTEGLAKTQARRRVSFSDVSRWKDQGSYPSLNQMPTRSMDKLLKDTLVPPTRSSSGQGNHVWSTTQPNSNPRRTKNAMILARRTMRSSLEPQKPRRRGSNEFQPECPGKSSSNVFQSSLKEFLLVDSTSTIRP